MKFNRSKFNIKSSQSNKISANVNIIFNSVVKNNQKEIYISKISINRDFNTSIDFFIEKKATGENIKVEINSKSISSNLIYLENISSEIDIYSSAIASQLGEEYLEIKGINVVAGDVIEINMSDLTVFKNDVNVLDLVNSDFFDLLSGVNDIQIEVEGEFEVVAFWKDRWL